MYDVVVIGGGTGISIAELTSWIATRAGFAVSRARSRARAEDAQGWPLGTCGGEVGRAR